MTPTEGSMTDSGVALAGERLEAWVTERRGAALRTTTDETRRQFILAHPRQFEAELLRDLPELARMLGEIRAGRHGSDRGVAMLESVLKPDIRPLIRIVDGDYPVSADPGWPDLDEPGVRARLRNAVRCTGRITMTDSTGSRIVGTGWVAGRDLIMTCRHVAEEFVRFTGRGPQVRMCVGCTAKIDFGEGEETGRAPVIEVVVPVVVHPRLDLALLRVGALPPELKPLKLAARPAPSERVAVIGYPGRDATDAGEATTAAERLFSETEQALFGGVYDVKRLSPGRLFSPGLVKTRFAQIRGLPHDASTRGGSSGSPVLDLTTGHVVGLHFQGAFGGNNWSVPSDLIVGDRRLREEGIAFVGMPGPDEMDAFWHD